MSAGAIFNIAMTIVPMIAGGVMGGLQAAKQQCKFLNQTKEVKEQTAKFVKSQEDIYKSLERLDQNILNTTVDLQEKMTTIVKKLQISKNEFAISMKKLQLIIACIIIIVFMLLLGKKLKIY